MSGAIVSGDRQVPMGELQARARRAAQGFESSGVGEGDALALVLRNDIPFFEAALAAQMLGAYAVPVNWHYGADEAGYVIRDSGAKAVVIHADLHRPLETAIPGDVPALIVPTPPEVAAAYGVDDLSCSVPEGARDWAAWRDSFEPWPGPPRPPRPNMVYTSGTTGRPKGVRRRPFPPGADMAVLDRLRRQVFGVHEGVRVAITGPLYHSAPNAYALRAVMLEALVVLQPRFDPEALLALIERHRITHMHMVPTMFVRLLRLPEAVRARYDVSSLEWVVHGAAPCPRAVKERMIDWFGPVIHEYYGSTEGGTITVADSHESLARPGTVGRPVESAEVRIYDEAGKLVAPGEVGEIYSRVHALPDFTYHGDEAMRRGIERDGLMTSGDVGYLDADGYLYLCDRKKDMVISGGVNIYPAEVEAVLMEMPGVHDCAVFGIPDEEYGEALAAAIEPERGARLTADAVIDWLNGRQARFKTPRHIEFHQALPREDSGKIFKRRLREPYWRDAGRAI